MKKRRLKRVAICTAAVLLALLCIHSAATVIIYEAIFSSRFQTPGWMPELADYEGLISERSDFLNSDGERLAGYKYFKEGSEPRSAVIVSHGFGNGHRPYLPFIDAFASAGYLVFAYDGTGNDASEGNGTKGLVQAVVDLEAAILHVKTLPCYRELPLMLFGHSMGAYAAGAVLGLCSDIKAAALIAPFNESEDMLRYESGKYVGPLADVLLPSVAYYEWLKFGGKYADLSVSESVKRSDAAVLVASAADDVTVPPECGAEILGKELRGVTRVEFLQYTDGGHTDIMYSFRAREYRRSVSDTAQINKKLYFEVNEELLFEITELFGEALS